MQGLCSLGISPSLFVAHLHGRAMRERHGMRQIVLESSRNQVSSPLKRKQPEGERGGGRGGIGRRSWQGAMATCDI
jgi:hypothetical protein